MSSLFAILVAGLALSIFSMVAQEHRHCNIKASILGAAGLFLMIAGVLGLLIAVYLENPLP